MNDTPLIEMPLAEAMEKAAVYAKDNPTIASVSRTLRNEILRLRGLRPRDTPSNERLDELIAYIDGFAVELYEEGDVDDSRRMLEVASVLRHEGVPMKCSGHDEAQARIAAAVREIQILSDEYGYDPAQWLQDEVAQEGTPRG
jgi:hypothetical protein